MPRSRPPLRRFGLRGLAGSIVVACAALGSGIALAAAGDFDTGFGTGGTARSDFDGSAVADVAVQSDGKILAVGTGETDGSPADDETAALGRYTTAGAPDPAFLGGMGVSGAGQYDMQPTRLLGVVPRPDNHIVTAGFKEIAGDPTDTVGVLAQHVGTGIIQGILHTGFAGDGVLDVIFTAGDPSRMHDVARDPASGDFVAVGQTIPSGVMVPRYGIASVTSAGAFESGFGTGGTGKLVTSPSVFVTTLSGLDDVANAVAIRPNSAIVVAGNSDPSPADGGSNDDNDVSLAFLTATGSATFHDMIDIGDADTGADMVLQPDGKILITGTTTTAGDPDHFLMRLESDGDPDPTFGDGADGIFVQSAVSGDNFGNSLVLLPDGRIVVVGFKSAGSDWVVARYTSAGMPDPTFDGDGSRLYDLTPDAGNLFAATAQPDGKLVVGGSIAGDWAVGRLLADDPPPVVNPPVTPLATPVATPPKKCKKGQKLRKGKCVKKKRKRRK